MAEVSVIKLEKFAAILQALKIKITFIFISNLTQLELVCKEKKNVSFYTQKLCKNVVASEDGSIKHCTA